MCVCVCVIGRQVLRAFDLITVAGYLVAVIYDHLTRGTRTLN